MQIFYLLCDILFYLYGGCLSANEGTDIYSVLCVTCERVECMEDTSLTALKIILDSDWISVK